MVKQSSAVDKWFSPAVIIFLIVQTASSIWWASRTQATLDFLSRNYVEIKQDISLGTADRYTATTAAKDFAVRDMQIRDINSQINELSRNQRTQ